MSFILDALKKSEKERQRSAVPGIADLPIVVHYRRVSAWTVALIAGLGLTVVALAFAWWRTSMLEPLAVEASRPPTGRAVPEPRRAPEAQSERATRSLASEATRVAEAAPRPLGAGSSVTARGAPAASTPPPAATGVITAGPMSITEARLAGMPVPELELELLVFSSDPARRFVYINSAKYAEGDTLAAGPQVVEITTEGAILSYRGRSYLLPQN